MEVFAFASFGILVLAWLVAPSRVITPVSKTEERKAA